MEQGSFPIGPLDGVRILDIGTFLALGNAGALMSDFGAELIKVEQPGVGDWLRGLGPTYKGESLRWKVVGRNKRSIAIDLRNPDGQQVIRELVAKSDVVLENYRPGTVDKWGLGYEQLREVNPGIIMLSLSGYGQTGPRRMKPGFGRDLEAIGGWMNSTGFPDGPPVQMGVALVDYITGVFAAMSVSMALRYRDVHPKGEGQRIDLSLYEAVVRLTDPLISEYDKLGVNPGRKGNSYPPSSPSNVYRTRDGRYINHNSGTQPMFERLAKAMGREELASDPRFNTKEARHAHWKEIDEIAADWFAAHDLDEICRILDEHDISYAPVNTMADLLADPQLLGRQSIVAVEDPVVGPLRQPGLVPKFSKTPGRIKHTGHDIGQDTEAVLKEVLGYGDRRLAELRQAGAFGATT